MRRPSMWRGREAVRRSRLGKGTDDVGDGSGDDDDDDDVDGDNDDDDDNDDDLSSFFLSVRSLQCKREIQ